MPYVPAPTRYDDMPYRRSGRSGLLLPAISLGLWQNFGHGRPIDGQRAVIHRAFDLGITHFDLANNYGPPYGSAEENFGRILATDLAPYRDELVISSKAGYDMWPGPYGDRGSRKYLTASLDQSLRRMGLDYVDIFYSHRFDPETPLEETMGALDTAVRQGKALYAGISSYSAAQTKAAAAILRSMGTPLLITQPSYSMINRWIEGGLLAENVEEASLDPPVDHRVGRLRDEERRSHGTQDGRRRLRLGGRVGGDPGVERLALSNRSVEGAHRLLERRLRVEPVRVEDVDVVEAHPAEALVQARRQVLARAAVTVRPGPHVVASLRRDDQLIAVESQVRREDPPEVLLRRAIGRPVVVRQVEVGDPEVERAVDDRALAVDRPAVPEVLPEAERDRGQEETAPTRSPVGHVVVARGSRYVWHAPILPPAGRGRPGTPTAPGPALRYGRRFAHQVDLDPRHLGQDALGERRPPEAIHAVARVVGEDEVGHPLVAKDLLETPHQVGRLASDDLGTEIDRVVDVRLEVPLTVARQLDAGRLDGDGQERRMQGGRKRRSPAHGPAAGR